MNFVPVGFFNTLLLHGTADIEHSEKCCKNQNLSKIQNQSNSLSLNIIFKLFQRVSNAIRYRKTRGKRPHGTQTSLGHDFEFPKKYSR